MLARGLGGGWGGIGVEGRGGRAQLLEKATGIGVVHGQLGTGVEKNKAQVCGRGLQECLLLSALPLAAEVEGVLERTLLASLSTPLACSILRGRRGAPSD